MPTTVPLDEHLRRTSRAFYLSLRLLPRPTRGPIGVAYALARTADSVADLGTESPARRRERLATFLALVGDPAGAADFAREVAPAVPAGAERDLVLALPDTLAAHARQSAGDRTRIEAVLATIVEGMTLDLTWFDTATPPAAIPTRADLDRYTYCVAGCVGEFWTRMQAAHLPAYARASDEAMLEAGVRFGKALQLTNILRDLPRDLAAGRCYLPADALEVEPGALLDPAAWPRVRPLVHDLVAVAIEHARAGVAYTLALSRRHPGLRTSCALPLAMAIETLGLVAAEDRLLDPAVVLKVPRRRVWQLVRSLALRSVSDRALAAALRSSLRRARFDEKG